MYHKYRRHWIKYILNNVKKESKVLNMVEGWYFLEQKNTVVQDA